MFLRQKHVVNSLMKLAPELLINLKYSVDQRYSSTMYGISMRRFMKTATHKTILSPNCYFILAVNIVLYICKIIHLYC